MNRWKNSNMKLVSFVYRKAHMCAEILSVNNEEISRAIVSNEEACSLFFDFLDSRKLNHVIVNFYMKILSQIISRFPDQVCIWFLLSSNIYLCDIELIMFPINYSLRGISQNHFTYM